MSKNETTGAGSIVASLSRCGVTACFANPGTSEMHLVAALDKVPSIRSVLCLFEGVASGAADGFGRMTDRPAAVLLHLGPGYANAAANLHNARRAHTPVVVIIGDHATSHRQYDAPLASDIRSLTSSTCRWTGSIETAAAGAELVQRSVEESMTAERGVAALLLPADSAWTLTDIIGPSHDFVAPTLALVPDDRIDAVRNALNNAINPAILLGGHALREDALAIAGSLAASGIRIFGETFPARQTRGAAVFSPERLPYSGPQARDALLAHDLLVTVEAADPVAFFAYPSEEGRLAPAGMRILNLASCGEDGTAALAGLGCAGVIEAGKQIDETFDPAARPTPLSAGKILARLMPVGSIVSDDAVTASGPLWAGTENSETHEWMTLTGGAIGQGLPLAIGAAVACPGRKVIALTGDGAGMYNPQSLWTMMREKLDIVVLVFANNAYRILEYEYERTGAGKLTSAHDMFDLSGPTIDWVSIARGFGMRGTLCKNNGELSGAIERAMKETGPCLIEISIE